jgi:hypothetical protein
MLLKFLEEKYLVSARIEECSSLIQEALNEAGLKNVTTEKQVPPHYLLVTYSPGWVGKSLEMEFVFKERQNGTEVSVRWSYAKEAPSDNQNPAEFYKQEKERKQRTERLIDKFKNKIGATDILTS